MAIYNFLSQSHRSDNHGGKFGLQMVFDTRPYLMGYQCIDVVNLDVVIYGASLGEGSEPIIRSGKV